MTNRGRVVNRHLLLFDHNILCFYDSSSIICFITLFYNRILLYNLSTALLNEIMQIFFIHNCRTRKYRTRAIVAHSRMTPEQLLHTRI